ncbi:hypothetical protein ASZ90_010244 [hydrocarbon metagenome]|uniref:Uncharacterized protein n=1 Tax=hydrocarbon metagenome TaxID=938273 RepID=A0A0W8FGK8_9ZZZZ
MPRGRRHTGLKRMVAFTTHSHIKLPMKPPEEAAGSADENSYLCSDTQ